MWLKIVVKDAISGMSTDPELYILNSIYEELFQVDGDTFTAEQLESLTLQVEQKCNYRAKTVEYFESQDGQFWNRGIMIDKNIWSYFRLKIPGNSFA